MVTKEAKDNYARSALGRHRELLKWLAALHRKWDLVVLQSYRDDGAGEASTYVEYAPKFAALIATATPPGRLNNGGTDAGGDAAPCPRQSRRSRESGASKRSRTGPINPDAGSGSGGL